MCAFTTIPFEFSNYPISLFRIQAFYHGGRAPSSSLWKVLLPGRQDFYSYVDDRGSQEVELYDLEADIGERRNLAGEYPDIAAEMVKYARGFRWPEQIFDNPIRLPARP